MPVHSSDTLSLLKQHIRTTASCMADCHRNALAHLAADELDAYENQADARSRFRARVAALGRVYRDMLTDNERELSSMHEQFMRSQV